jgi:hypothetical protein
LLTILFDRALSGRRGQSALSGGNPDVLSYLHAYKGDEGSGYSIVGSGYFHPEPADLHLLGRQ